MRRRSASQKECDIRKATGLMHRLERFAMTNPDEKDYEKAQMQPGQVQAAQILLKKLVPDLTAVEQTNIDERDMMTEEQIIQQMQTLIESSPDIAKQLRDLLKPKEVKQEKAA